MRSFVDKESDGVAIDGDLQDEVRRRPRLDGLPQDPVVVAVDQRLVEVKHKRLALHETCENERSLTFSAFLQQQ